MNKDKRLAWAVRLDKFCAIAGALVPMGLVIGNIGFELLIALVGLFWIIRCVVVKENPFRELLKQPLVIPWMVWFAGIVLSLVVNGPGSKGWAHDIVFIRYVLFGLALLDISQRLPMGKYLLYGLAAGVIWAAINTISAYVFGNDLLGKPLVRYTGKLKEASRISGMAAYASAFFIVWGLGDNKLSVKLKIIVTAIGLLALGQVLQTHVRTATIASVAGIFFGAAYLVQKKVLFRFALVALAGAILCAGFILIYKDVWNLDSVYNRIYYWKVAWQMWLEHPVLGVGVSSFQDAYKEMAVSGLVPEFIAPDGRTFSEIEQTHAHNLVLMLISSTGLLGLGAFTWLFIAATCLVFKNMGEFRYGLISWPAVLLVIGITGFNIYHSWYQALLAFWLVLIGTDDSGFEVGRSAD